MKFSALIPRFVSKIILFLVLLVAVFSLSSSLLVAHAQDQTKDNVAVKNTLSAKVNPDVPKNLHTWTQTVLIEVLSAMTCQLTGVDLSNANQQCLGVDQKTGKIGFVKDGGGTIAVATTMIGVLYTPPIHTSDFTNYLAKNFGIAKSSYAATGSGYDQLRPLMEIWKTFRNISYAFFVIVFLLIGIGIMLRSKIDPRTVMTIQNQIPKIIIGLVLVTFSYAIAGFLVDLMWSTIYVTYDIVRSVPGANVNTITPMDFQTETPIGIMNKFGDPVLEDGISNISNTVSVYSKEVLQKALGVKSCDNPLDCLAGTIFNPITMFWDKGLQNPVEILFNLVSTTTGTATFFKVSSIANFTTPVIGDILNLFAGKVLGVAAGITMYGMTQFILREFVPWLIIYLIIYIAILFSLIRLWFELIKCYISILIAIILAPFWIMAGLIPGSNSLGFTSWLKELAANLMAFPAVIATFLIGKVLMDSFSLQANMNAGFVPPLLGSMGGIKLLGALIGFGIILTTPQVVSMVKKAFKAQGGFGGIGGPIGAATSVPMAGARGVGSYMAKAPQLGQKGGFTAVARQILKF